MKDEPERLFRVLRNHEQQYSLWPKDKPTPQGWENVGVEGSREICAAYVEAAWKDMRPLSAR